jgi:ABC-type sulfate/molybdate transport systems ATPase subunit
VFVRPHDFDILFEPNGRPAMRARIDRINSAGPHVKVELTNVQGEYVQVALPHERSQTLQLKAGTDVYVSAREYKVFGEDYSI